MKERATYVTPSKTRYALITTDATHLCKASNSLYVYPQLFID